MSGVELSFVVKELVRIAAKPAAAKAQRNVGILRTLRKFGLQPNTPPKDFDGVYAYTLVAACWGSPEPIIRFFEDKHLREAFRLSFETGDPQYLVREADELFQWNEDRHAAGSIDYDPRRSLTAFTATFNSMVDATRTPVETRSEVHARSFEQDARNQLTTIAEKLGTLDVLDEIVSELQILRSTATTPSDAELEGTLSEILKLWFDAVGHTREDFEELDEHSFTWVINVAARRGKFDRVVVRGVTTEAGVSDIEYGLAALERTRGVEVWVVANRRVSEAARRLCEEEEGLVRCFTLDELIEEDADFSPYLDWLENEALAKGVDTRYIDMACEKEEHDSQGNVLGTSVYDSRNGWIDGYIDSWMEDNSKEHLSILGEFGMGKTWVAFHYALKLAKEYRVARAKGYRRPRIPLLVPLRDFTKSVSIEMLFSEFFFTKHELQLPGFRAFMQLNRMGRFVLIFDGFDEMAARIDRQSMVNHFWELARTVVPNAKVILTCRSEHFPDAAAGRQILGAKLKASTASTLMQAPKFETVELRQWTDDQVRNVLNTMTDAPTVDKVMSTDDLLELLRRPVMAELVLDALPDIRAGAEVDLTRVYFYAMRRKMARDILDERTFTSMADKLYFLCELSWEMLSKAKAAVNYREFPETLRRCFGETVAEERDLDHWQYDMLGQTILIRNADGDYYPPHRSFIEFFAAYKYAAELGLLASEFADVVNDGIGDEIAAAPVRFSELIQTDESGERISKRVSTFAQEPPELLRRTFGGSPLTAPIDTMLIALSRSSQQTTDALVELIRYTRARSAMPSEASWLGGNSASLAVRIDESALAGVDLNAVDIVGASFDVHGANWRGADLTAVDLSKAYCRGCDFENAVLQRAKFCDSDLTDAGYLGASGKSIVKVEESTEENILWIATKDGNIFRASVGFTSDEPSMSVDLAVGTDGNIRRQIVDAERSLDGHYLMLMFDVAQVGIIDLHRSDLVGCVDGVTGAVFVDDEDGQVAEVAYWRLDDENVLGRMSLTSGEQLPDVTWADIDPSALSGAFSASSRGACVISIEEDEGEDGSRSVATISALRIQDGELIRSDPVVVDLAGIEGSLIGQPGPSVAGGYSRECAWLECATGSEGWRAVAAVDPFGHVLFHYRYAGRKAARLSPDGEEYRFVGDHEPFQWFEWFSRGEFGRVHLESEAAAVLDDGVLSLWSTTDPETVIWSTERLGITSVAFCVGGRALVGGTIFGDVFLIGRANGKILAQANVSKNLTEADFTGAIGLHETVAAGLRRQGAVVP